ncbi:hypothetical protein C8Q80DRAFT_1271685 [Daedaleopsis nitida]|nr:hypothetical protein C8Q80DRAFT_1271685 [Daedaleopsis nitida]
MASSDGDSIPFALRIHTLVPLDIAFARNDIRRRDEPYESRSSGTSVYAVPQYQAPIVATALSSPLSYQTITSHPSTLASIYSHPSCPPDEDLYEDGDSVIALYDVYKHSTHNH